MVLTCAGILSLYIDRVIRIYRAQRSADSVQIAGLERAIQLSPGNADFHDLLGVQLSASDEDSESASASLRRAVALNPNRARYWLDLAAVYQVADDVREQNEAVQTALNAEPGNPEVAGEAGLFFLVAGDLDRALPLFRRALAQNPEAAANILPACWRNTRNANLMLASVIPDSPDLQLQFLGLLTQQKEAAAANQVWHYLITSGRNFPPRLSFFYLDCLVKERDVAGFDRAWHELARLNPTLRNYLPSDNLIVNAGFEQPILNSGFDWRHESAGHVAAAIDDTVAHSESRSLSLFYDGNPAYDAGWMQLVPVQPNAEYQLSLWIKSENVTTSSGPRVAIADAYSGANLLLTDDVLDTHPWQEMTGTFRAPVSTQLIAVKILRAPADTRIRGRVWIDDLRLVKK